MIVSSFAQGSSAGEKKKKKAPRPYRQRNIGTGNSEEVSQELKPSWAVGHGKVWCPDAGTPGQHWFPAHMVPLTGQATWAVDSQPLKVSSAVGHGKVLFPVAWMPGQHWLPAHIGPSPPHWTCSGS